LIKVLFFKHMLILGLFSLTSFLFTPNVFAYEGCKYNGKTLDTSKSETELGAKFISKAPYNFTGLMECFHSNGKISKTEEFKNGQLNGVTKIFDEQGHLQEEAHMKDGKRSGNFKRYHHKTYKLVHDWNYKDGELAGLAKYYFDDTSKIEQIRIISPDQNGSEMRYNKFGKLTSLECKSIPIPNEDIELCGRKGLGKKVTLYFSDNDKIRETLTYKNLKLEGEVLSYKTNGELISKKTYKTGELVSEERFNPKGNYKLTYEGKKKLDSYFYPNGKLQESTITNGKEKTITTYFASGKLQKTKITDGFDTLSEKEFYENGSRKLESKKDGELSSVTSYYDNDQVNCTYTVKNNHGYLKYEGPYNCFYEDGKPKSKENYFQSKLEGEQLYFFSDGIASKKLNYKSGVLLETWIYDETGKLKENYQHEPDGSRKLK
jgi:antitoxin component YwqK of YwqJK toxin-antitoxin module